MIAEKGEQLARDLGVSTPTLKQPPVNSHFSLNLQTQIVKNLPTTKSSENLHWNELARRKEGVVCLQTKRRLQRWFWETKMFFSVWKKIETCLCSENPFAKIRNQEPWWASYDKGFEFRGFWDWKSLGVGHMMTFRESLIHCIRMTVFFDELWFWSDSPSVTLVSSKIGTYGPPLSQPWPIEGGGRKFQFSY